MRAAALLCLVLAACSGGASEPASAVPDVAAPADPGPSAPDPITCEHACNRVPKCAPDKATEQDCLALCRQAADAHAFACCIQYAADCTAVQGCIESEAPACAPAGEPWVPIPLFGQCECGDPAEPTPTTSECKAQKTDTICETGLCLKVVNSDAPPFCAVECTNQPKVCPEGTYCVETPRSWYCRRK